MLVTTARVPSQPILHLPFGRRKHNPLISLKSFWARLLAAPNCFGSSHEETNKIPPRTGMDND
jgi:hypothetical protein